MGVRNRFHFINIACVFSQLHAVTVIQQPSFDLPCHSLTLLNRFCTGRCPCRANMHKWGLS